MAKKALLVGCNYPGQRNQLHGCCNDARRMLTVLTTRFGFDEADINVLLDDDEAYKLSTGANIRLGLENLIAEPVEGDSLVFFFSGHGSQLRFHENGGFEADNTGREEAIVPTDYNLLTDDDFRNLVDRIPEGVKFTFISDSCFSGGLIDSAEEQHTGGHAEAPISHGGDLDQSVVEGGTAKRMTEEMVASRLNERVGAGYQVEVGNIHTALYDLFRDQASLSVRMFERLVLMQLNEEQHDDGLVGITVSQLEVDCLRERLEAQDDREDYLAAAKSAEVYRPRPPRQAAEMGILLSGCKAGELSKDNPMGGPENAYGEFTKAIETVLTSQSETPLTNREMVMEARKVLAEKGVEDQHPCLFCSDANADQVFICDYEHHV